MTYRLHRTCVQTALAVRLKRYGLRQVITVANDRPAPASCLCLCPDGLHVRNYLHRQLLLKMTGRMHSLLWSRRHISVRFII